MVEGERWRYSRTTCLKVLVTSWSKVSGRLENVVASVTACVKAMQVPCCILVHCTLSASASLHLNSLMLIGGYDYSL